MAKKTNKTSNKKATLKVAWPKASSKGGVGKVNSPKPKVVKKKSPAKSTASKWPKVYAKAVADRHQKKVLDEQKALRMRIPKCIFQMIHNSYGVFPSEYDRILGLPKGTWFDIALRINGDRRSPNSIEFKTKVCKMANIDRFIAMAEESLQSAQKHELKVAKETIKQLKKVKADMHKFKKINNALGLY